MLKYVIVYNINIVRYICGFNSILLNYLLLLIELIILKKLLGCLYDYAWKEIDEIINKKLDNTDNWELIIRLIKTKIILKKISSIFNDTINYKIDNYTDNNSWSPIFRTTLAEKMKIYCDYIFGIKFKNIIVLLIVVSPLYEIVSLKGIMVKINEEFDKLDINTLNVIVNTLVPMIGFLVIFFSLRYARTNGEMIRAINRVHKQDMEEIVVFYSKLNNLLIDPIFKGLENINYAYMNKEMLVKTRIELINPYIVCTNDKYIISFGQNRSEFIEQEIFYDISEIAEIKELIYQIKSKGLIYKVPIFLRRSKKLSGAYKIPLFSKDEDIDVILNNMFITKTSVKMLLDSYLINRSEFDRICNKDKIEESDLVELNELILREKENFSKRLDKMCINSLTDVVELAIYLKKSLSILRIDANKFDKIVNYIMDRE